MCASLREGNCHEIWVSVAPSHWHSWLFCALDWKRDQYKSKTLWSFSNNLCALEQVCGLVGGSVYQHSMKKKRFCHKIRVSTSLAEIQDNTSKRKWWITLSPQFISTNLALYSPVVIRGVGLCINLIPTVQEVFGIYEQSRQTGFRYNWYFLGTVSNTNLRIL